MTAIEEGRVCVLKAGRRAEERVVITEVGKGYAMVKDKKGKERKVSVKHLEPTEKTA